MPFLTMRTAPSVSSSFSGAVVVAAGLALASCSGQPARAAAPPGGGGPAPVAVSTIRVVERAMPVNVQAVGTAEASSTVDIHSQVTGTLLTVDFKEGQDVSAGQLLFTIDPRPFEVALQQAQAALARDTAQSRNAEAQLARYKELTDAGLTAQADLDAVTAQASVSQAAMAADQAQIDSATLQRQYTRIAAPVSGRTGALLVHRGSLVRANDTSPLVVINQVAPIFVSFAVPARLLDRIQSVQRSGPLVVDARNADAEAPVATGRVQFIDNAVDRTTDTIRLKAEFPNGDRRLWPGQFLEVTLRLAVEPHALVVPSAAVQAGQQGSFVFVVSNGQDRRDAPGRGRLDRRRPGRAAERRARGGEVVTDGQLRLTPGAPVTVKPAVPAPKAGR